MHIHAALDFIAEQPEAADLPSVEIEFGRVLQAQDDRVFAMRCWVWAQCGAMMSRHSTASFSRNRYVAIVSPHPFQDFGMLADGVSEKRAMIFLARLSRRASPRSMSANSTSVQCVESVILREPKDESKPENSTVYNRFRKRLNVNGFIDQDVINQARSVAARCV
jgi:hypothetical protein